MLIISRRIGEALYVGDDVKLIVLETSEAKQKAKIAIDSPDNIPVFPEERVVNNDAVNPAPARGPKIIFRGRRRVRNHYS